MIGTFQDLIRHKAWSDAALIGAIRGQEQASRDEALLKLLHHMILANRFWLSLSLGRPFAFDEESRPPQDLDALAAIYRRTQNDELEWISHVTHGDLERRVQTPFLPDRDFTVAQGMMQVCMHSQGHRAQCAARLRELGGTPPASDFVLWLRDRPQPAWW